MSSDTVDRKIAVILATDVVGYSKHMETNEKETVKNLKACEKILTKTFENHKGRLFNTGGDSFLIEFPSAVEAVECAVSFQEQIKKRNTTDNPTVPLEFRIGINTGDVIQDNENLLGDGVNIAARLEALAQPKGITISKAVYDFIKGKTNFNYNDLGIQKIKQNEFHAYDILLDPSQKRTLKTQSSTNFKLFTVIAIPLIIALVSFLMLSLNGEEEEITEFQETSKPVILVTPIKASGLSEDQQGFARGITESMISTFSRYTGIRVLSSSTSFHVSEKNMTDEEILDEYGVNFVIRGSMQVMGNNARLNVEVTDLKIGEVVKTEKRDFELSKIFKVQDEISDKVLGSIQTDLGTGEYIKTFMAQLDNIEDFTMSLNWIRTWRSYSPEGYKKSKAILDELNSRYPQGNPFLDVLGSWQISQKIRLNLSDDVEADKKKLRSLLEQITTNYPKYPDAFNARALIGLTRLGATCEEAIADIDHAEKMGGGQETLMIGAAVYNNCGQGKKAISRLKEVLKLVPNDPRWFQTGLLVSFMYQDKQAPEKIYEIVGDKINAEDMDPRILAIYSIFEFDNGNKEKAISYYKRAIKNGFRKDRLEFSNDQKYTAETHAILDKIDSLASK